jgi:anti-anti-sigma factor
MAVSVQSDVPDVVGGGLRIAITEQGSTTTVAVEGEWDIAKLLTTRQAVFKALARQPECVVLDLSALSFIDSSGVHCVIELARRSQRLSIRLVIIPGPKAVHRIFEICQLTGLLPFVPVP